MKIKQAHCSACNAPRKVERQTPNHILHLLLSVLTGGLWLVVWIALALIPRPWRCATCGSSRVGMAAQMADGMMEKKSAAVPPAGVALFFATLAPLIYWLAR